jgi:hypothetical protein
MPFYRCYFFDEQRQIIFPADISAGDLDSAKRHAFGILQENNTDPEFKEFDRPVASLEIWVGAVMLFRS